MNESTYDLIIIGGGPTGLACGIAAAKADLNYLILEKGVLVNSLYHFPTNMTFFSTSKLLEIGKTPFVSHGEKPTRREALEYYRRLLQNYQLQIHTYEEVNRLEPRIEGGYELGTNKAQYHCEHVIVATGFYDTPRKLNVTGEHLPKVKHYFDEAHPYVGQEVLVVGAANSACQVALELFRKGAKVSMAIRKSEIYKGVKYWIKPDIQNRIKEGSIKAYFNTQVNSISEKSVSLSTAEGAIEIPNDWVMAMTGYLPDYPFLEKLGVQIQQDEYRLPFFNPDTLESNLEGVYLAGVILAGLHTSKLFIENTRDHGQVIVEQLLKKRELKIARPNTF